MAIQYLKGDATKVQSTGGLRILAHICNNEKGWGSGFVVALSKCWPEPEAAYRAWSSSGKKFELGQVQFVPVHDQYGKLYVANMVAQDGFTSLNRDRAVHYGALIECLNQLDEWIKSFLYVKGLMWGKSGATTPPVSIHMPRMIGCGLGGGEEDVVVEIIEKTVGHHEVFAYEYEL